MVAGEVEAASAAARVAGWVAVGKVAAQAAVMEARAVHATGSRTEPGLRSTGCRIARRLPGRGLDCTPPAAARVAVGVAWVAAVVANVEAARAVAWRVAAARATARRRCYSAVEGVRAQAPL